jgi:16S rRNA (guanine966-N2)-methyltransferase
MCAPQAPFNYIFLDPPYLKGLAEKAVISAVQGGWLAPDHLIVIEESREASLSLPEPLSMLDQRVCGESQFMIGRWNF